MGRQSTRAAILPIALRQLPHQQCTGYLKVRVVNNAVDAGVKPGRAEIFLEAR